MASALFRKTVTIRFQHCDPAGIVYYPRFLDMAEAAIEDWMAEAIREPYRDWIVAEGRALPRVKLVCEFLKPCRMGERLTLAIRLRKLGRSSLELETVGEVAGETRLKVAIIMVNMSLESGRAVAFAPSLREKLARYLVLSAAEASRPDAKP